MEDLMQTYNVSRETFKTLSDFVDILTNWQAKMNLVSSKSLPEIWTRHIADSLELYQYLNADAKRVYDIGSGAGFPAIVLAIAAQGEKRQTSFKLIESITKKTLYLNDVKNKLGLKNVEIINGRAENLKLLPANFVTARAVANLSKLFSLALPLTDKKTVLILPKGKTYQEEIIEAKKIWAFDVIVKKNQVSDDGVVLIVSNLRKLR
jgi:16S rRNA (guanine527-N7)-methyltransferase